MNDTVFLRGLIVLAIGWTIFCILMISNLLSILWGLYGN